MSSNKIKPLAETPDDILETFLTFDILDPMARTASWFLYKRNVKSGKVWVAEVLFKEAPQLDTRTLPPSFLTSLLAVQYLTDRAWMAGVKPSDGTGSAGSLRATEEHVETLQRELKAAHETIGGLTKILAGREGKQKLRIRVPSEDEEKDCLKTWWDSADANTIPL